MTIRNYFDLGLGGADSEAGNTRTQRPPLNLGRKKPQGIGWEITAWLAVAAGIFARQGLQITKLTWDLSNIRVGAGVASVVVALAVFPMMMRWFVKRTQRGTLELVAAPFAFGFFIDLAALALVRLPSIFVNRV